MSEINIGDIIEIIISLMGEERQITGQVIDINETRIRIQKLDGSITNIPFSQLDNSFYNIIKPNKEDANLQKSLKPDNSDIQKSGTDANQPEKKASIDSKSINHIASDALTSTKKTSNIKKNTAFSKEIEEVKKKLEKAKEYVPLAVDDPLFWSLSKEERTTIGITDNVWNLISEACTKGETATVLETIPKVTALLKKNVSNKKITQKLYSLRACLYKILHDKKAKTKDPYPPFVQYMSDINAANNPQQVIAASPELANPQKMLEESPDFAPENAISFLAECIKAAPSIPLWKTCLTICPKYDMQWLCDILNNNPSFETIIMAFICIEEKKSDFSLPNEKQLDSKENIDQLISYISELFPCSRSKQTETKEENTPPSKPLVEARKFGYINKWFADGYYGFISDNPTDQVGIYFHAKYIQDESLRNYICSLQQNLVPSKRAIRVSYAICKNIYRDDQKCAGDIRLEAELPTVSVLMEVTGYLTKWIENGDNTFGFINSANKKNLHFLPVNIADPYLYSFLTGPSGHLCENADIFVKCTISNEGNEAYNITWLNKDELPSYYDTFEDIKKRIDPEELKRFEETGHRLGEKYIVNEISSKKAKDIAQFEYVKLPLWTEEAANAIQMKNQTTINVTYGIQSNSDDDIALSSLAHEYLTLIEKKSTLTIAEERKLYNHITQKPTPNWRRPNDFETVCKTLLCTPDVEISTSVASQLFNYYLQEKDAEKSIALLDAIKAHSRQQYPKINFSAEKYINNRINALDQIKASKPEYLDELYDLLEGKYRSAISIDQKSSFRYREAEVRVLQKRNSEARRLYRDCIGFLQLQHSSTSARQIATIYLRIALLYQQDGSPEKSKEYAREALKIKQITPEMKTTAEDIINGVTGEIDQAVGSVSILEKPVSSNEDISSSNIPAYITFCIQNKIDLEDAMNQQNQYINMFNRDTLEVKKPQIDAQTVYTVCCDVDKNIANKSHFSKALLAIKLLLLYPEHIKKNKRKIERHIIDALNSRVRISINDSILSYRSNRHSEYEECISSAEYCNTLILDQNAYVQDNLEYLNRFKDSIYCNLHLIQIGQMIDVGRQVYSTVYEDKLNPMGFMYEDNPRILTALLNLGIHLSTNIREQPEYERLITELRDGINRTELDKKLANMIQQFDLPSNPEKDNKHFKEWFDRILREWKQIRDHMRHLFISRLDNQPYLLGNNVISMPIDYAKYKNDIKNCILYRYLSPTDKKLVDTYLDILDQLSGNDLSASAPFASYENRLGVCDREIDALEKAIQQAPTEIGFEWILPNINPLHQNIKILMNTLCENTKPKPQIEIDSRNSGSASHDNVPFVVILTNSLQDMTKQDMTDINVSIKITTNNVIIKKGEFTVIERLGSGKQSTIDCTVDIPEKIFKTGRFGILVDIEYHWRSSYMKPNTPESISWNRVVAIAQKQFEPIRQTFSAGSGGTQRNNGYAYVPREKEMNTISNWLKMGLEDKRSIARGFTVYGQFRCGKTTLRQCLAEILDEWRDDNKFMLTYCSIEMGGAYTTFSDVWESVLDELLYSPTLANNSELRNILSDLNQRCLDAPANEKLKYLYRALDSIARTYPNHRLIILLDEFQKAYSSFCDNLIPEASFGDFKRLIEEKGVFFVIFAQDMWKDIERRFTNDFAVFEKHHLGVLLPKEAFNLVNNNLLLEDGTSRLDEEAVNAITEIANRSPYYIQFLGKQLIDYMNENRMTYIGAPQVRQFLDDQLSGKDKVASEEYPNIFHPQYSDPYSNEIDRNTKILLWILARNYVQLRNKGDNTPNINVEEAISSSNQETRIWSARLNRQLLPEILNRLDQHYVLNRSFNGVDSSFDKPMDIDTIVGQHVTFVMPMFGIWYGNYSTPYL